ncbi:MAG: PTS sugar transporter subunit IIB [Solobacterium sp.]|nr:PTS sugar transporter subunit IIB [Solobacterium sp.]
MISLFRIDDRMIHGQVVVNWARAVPCEGLIAVNDAASAVALLKKSFQSAAPGKKVFVWSKKEWEEKKDKVLASRDRYFVITKNAMDMRDLLLDHPFACKLKEVCVGPCAMQEGSVHIGDNQALNAEEAAALEELRQAGWSVVFALVKEKPVGRWEDFRYLFGFADSAVK